jgi:glycosyltransferase involved in cell wall biosynthesis
MFVSIIVSVLNRESDINKLIDCILMQSYKDFELIVVDNGSDDNTLNLVSQYKSEKIKVVDASFAKGSPYSARNLGIKASTGDVLAFIDGYADVSWLASGLDAMYQSNLDILAGQVILPTNSESTMYEIYDSIFSLDVQHMVKRYNAAPTANLFVKKQLFNEIGLFDENIRSGGDIFFTSQASKSGYLLGYSDLPKSYYFTRNKAQLIEKQRRVAKGQVNIWERKRKVKLEVLKTFIKFMIPFNPITTFTRIQSKATMKVTVGQIIMLYFIRHKLDRIRLFNTLLIASKL